MIRRTCVIAIAVLGWASSHAAAQSGLPRATSTGELRFELGVHLSSVASSEFDEADIGIGGRFSWHPITLIGLEAEMTIYPRDFPDGRAFSRGRDEGLFGVTVGPRLGRLRPFARVRAGFMRFQEAPQPFPCIRIFPPPLRCSLASGRTARAVDIGGGVELFATRRTFFRIDAGDLLLRYPGPVFDSQRTPRQDGFVSHNLRLAAGGGFRF